MENKSSNSLAVCLGKALNGTTPPLCGRQVARTGEEWAPPGILVSDSLHNEYNQKQIGQSPRDK